MFFRRKQQPYGNSRERPRRERRVLSPLPKRRGKGGLLRLLGEFCSWLGFLLLVTGAIVGGGLYFLHARFDDAVRTHVEARFRTAYPKHRVALRAARRLEGQGIELRGLSIAELGENGVTLPLVAVDELLVQCNASVEELLAGQLNAKQIVLRRLKLHAARDAHGNWNVARLLPLPCFSSQQLPITIENSTLEVLLEGANGVFPATAEVQHLTLTPVENPDGTSPARVWQFNGVLAGTQLQQLAVKGDYDLVTNVWRADGNARGFKLSPELAEIAPAEYREQASWLKSFHASANARFHVTNADAKDWPVRLQIEGDIAGRIEDERLPFPLTDLKATFRGNNQSLEIIQASARVGQAALNLSCNIAGFREDAPCSLKLTAKRLQVDRQLVGTLPAEWGELWGTLAPEGIIDAEVSLIFDGQQVTQNAVVDCRDVSFAHHKYPYRLTNGQGRVEWRDDQLRFDDFRAYANGREVAIRGEIRNPGPEFDGFVTVDTVDDSNPVPIEEKLIAAIPESARNFVKQLNPVGAVTLHARIERHQSHPPIFHRELTIGVKNCAVNYDLFPYRLQKINGTIGMSDGQWKVREVLTGVNDSAWVECNGTWGPDESGLMQVAMEFSAQDVPLADELREALKLEVQKVWESIRPRGTVDQVKASVHYDGQTKKTSVNLTATKNPDSNSIKEKSITIQPVWLPYEMHDVAGILQCHDGVVELKNIRGRHSDMQARLSGIVKTTADGQWEVRLEPLNIDRVRSTHELRTALPQRLSNAVTKLNISGPFSVAGTMMLTGRTGETAPTSTQWNLDFDLEDGGIDCGVRLEHLHGGLKLVGGLDNRGLASRGSLDIDSLVYKGIQVTQVAGPISLDDERLGFGEWSTPIPEEGPSRPIHARLFGGTMLGSGEVKLSGDFPFNVEGRLSDGDLAAISREATMRRHDISGRTYADMRLQGTSHGAHTFLGNGNVQLRQADIYKLPLVATLLKVLTIKPLNDTAFTSSDVKYRIEGDRIYFEKISFNGDAFSLDGTGEMTLDGSLNLAFYTTIGREDFRDVILRPLLKEAGKRLVQILVTGTLAEPKIDQRIAPELNDTLQTWFPGQQPANRPNMTRLPTPSEMFDRLTPK